VRSVEPLAALGADQTADESVRHEVGEAVLAIEAALARVERALKAVPEGAEAWIDARRALERARTDLGSARRRLQQDAYFPTPQRKLF